MRRAVLDKQPRGFDVAMDVPEGPDPQRQVDRLEIGRCVAGGGPVQSVDVGAASEQKLNKVASHDGRRAMQWCATGGVAAMHQARVGIEQHSRAVDIVARRGAVNLVVDRVISRGNSTAALLCGFQHLGNSFMPTVESDRDQIVACQRHEIHVGACVQQQPNCLSMTLADREPDRLGVPVFGTDEVGVAREKAAERRHVALGGG